MTRFTLDPANLPTLSPEDAAALATQPVDLSDIPELPPSFFETAAAKQPVTIRLDRDVLAFFKAESRGYQTRINAVLRAFMDKQKQSTQTHKKPRAATRPSARG